MTRSRLDLRMRIIDVGLLRGLAYYIVARTRCGRNHGLTINKNRSVAPGAY